MMNRACCLIAIGYSMGADVLLGILIDLRQDLKEAITHTILLSQSTHEEYRFRFIGWLGYASKPHESLNILPQLETLKLRNLLCLSGEKETDSLSQILPASMATTQTLPGGHHYSGDYQALSKSILNHIHKTS